MPKEFQVGCKVPEMGKADAVVEKEVIKEVRKDEKQKMIKVGKQAPTFTAPAYYNGKFVGVDLEEYKGKWVLLCFYPGDFTFV